MRSLLILISLTSHILAQQLPPSVKMTPVVSLRLHSVKVHIPDRFRDSFKRDLPLNIPEGYTVKVFAAEGLAKPRFFAWSPDSILHVANKRSGVITAYPDRDRDGTADETRIAAEGFKKPHDLKFYRGDLYVADETQVFRCSDKNNDGIYETKEVFIDNIASGRGTGGHDTRTIVFDPKNSKMFLSIGSLCNVCREEQRALIEEYRDDGTGRRVFATGVRNAVGMTLHQGKLWATNNGFDWQGDDIPPEWIDVVRDGGFYGYPYAYAHGIMVDFTVNSQYQNLLPLTDIDKKKISAMVQPAALIQAHSAPMAIEFSNPSFPSRYTQGAFVALRGSWNRSVPTGYKIVYLSMNSPSDTVFTAVSDLITGFQDGNTRSSLWGRPVGLETDARGNLYFGSDDITEAIFILMPNK